MKSCYPEFVQRYGSYKYQIHSVRGAGMKGMKALYDLQYIIKALMNTPTTSGTVHHDLKMEATNIPG